MYIVISGNRSFKDYDRFIEEMDKHLGRLPNDICKDSVVLVTSESEGVDKMVDDYARLREYKLLRFPLEWKIYGKNAWKITNFEMAKIADALIAFWDSKSIGTKHMIDAAEREGVQTVIEYWEEQ